MQWRGRRLLMLRAEPAGHIGGPGTRRLICEVPLAWCAAYRHDQRPSAARAKGTQSTLGASRAATPGASRVGGSNVPWEN
jgi:hypothetical protein